MLSRLLKYDFRAVLKYWWLAALTSAALSVVGGVCVVILDNDYNQHFSFQAIAGLGIFLVVLGLSAFLLLSEILVYVRFYRNFYTDEGYLTFTLPVKRSDLLLSKLITAVSVSVMTAVVLCIDVAIIVVFALGDRLLEPSFWQGIQRVIDSLWDALGGYLPLYIAEALLTMLALTVFSVMLIFVCVTFASIVAKKHKALAAIGISYAASGVVSFVVQWLFMFALYGVDAWFSPMTDEQVKLVVALVLAVLTLFSAIVAAGLYILNLWMLDRRLNLS